MHGNPTARELQRMLFQGTPLPRPLLLPMVFSLGARIENVSLRAFLGNPTKITNAMRQLRGPLGADGITCYCDPFLEAEALGGTLEWKSEDGPPELRWPGRVLPDAIPSGLHVPEEAVKGGRIPVAVEVIRRLKALVRDELVLTAVITGPFTLAGRILRIDASQANEMEHLHPAAIELAAEMTTKVSSALVEAGANLLFVREETFPQFNPEMCEAWKAALEPAINVMRFYEAVPAVQLGSPASARQFGAYALREFGGAVVCLLPDAWSSLEQEAIAALNPAKVGIAIPSEMYDATVAATREPGVTGRWPTPAVITTPGDVSPTTEAKNLAKMLERAAAGN